MKFMTHRHKKLMEASEFALHHAASSTASDKKRIASTVLGNRRTYRTWENVHAELLYPVSQHRNDRRLLVELRKSQMGLVHHRALFHYLDQHNILGEKRCRLLRLLHSTLDFQDAVLLEHRQFMLAVSSRISSEHITHFMNDVESDNLVRRYERAYDSYFALKCEMATARSRSQVALIRPFVTDARNRLVRIRQRIETEVPTISGYSFEVQEALTRSGRYKALNYLNA